MLIMYEYMSIKFKNKIWPMFGLKFLNKTLLVFLYSVFKIINISPR